MLRRHFIINAESSILNNEIRYTSSDGNIVIPNNSSSLPEIDTNTYNNGKGVIKFKTYITSIGPYAFSGCNFTSIVIPNEVITIKDSAFRYCSSLTSITIPNSVTSIEYAVLSGCTSLTSVNIHNSVTSIKDLAFSGCSSLTSITIPDSVTSIGERAFYACYKLILITYTGTTSQWDTITKGVNWHKDIPATVVHCADGDVEI